MVNLLLGRKTSTKKDSIKKEYFFNILNDRGGKDLK